MSMRYSVWEIVILKESETTRVWIREELVHGDDVSASAAWAGNKFNQKKQSQINFLLFA